MASFKNNQHVINVGTSTDEAKMDVAIGKSNESEDKVVIRNDREEKLKSRSSPRKVIENQSDESVVGKKDSTINQQGKDVGTKSDVGKMDIVSGESDHPDDKVVYRKDRGANMNSIKRRRQVIEDKTDEFCVGEKESIDKIEKPKIIKKLNISVKPKVIDNNISCF